MNELFLQSTVPNGLLLHGIQRAMRLFVRVSAEVNRKLSSDLGTRTERRISPRLTDAELCRALGIQAPQLSTAINPLEKLGMLVNERA